MKKVLLTLVFIVAAFVPASLASAATKAPVNYSAKTGVPCRVHFRKETVTISKKEKVKGKTKTVKVRTQECVYVAPKVTTPAVIVPTGAVGTTKAADPPTDVIVTSSANPAAINSPVTYTITVASVAIPNTTGQIEVSDNGQPISGCFPIENPTYNADGTFSGTCTVTYAQPETDTITGVFTGDDVFAQSAGSMSETIEKTVAKTPPASGGGGGGGGTSNPAPTIALAVMLGSPAYTQSNSDYLSATYSATGSTTSNGSPAATADGTLDFYSDSVLTCTQAVGSLQPSGTCAVTYSQYGDHSIDVTYDDNSGDTSDTGGITEDIEPPAITVNNVWGTTFPTANPTVEADVQNSSANVTVTDGNFQGATSLTVTDNFSDTCTATVATSTTATCAMTVTGVPTYFTVAYPGGTTTQTTQAAPPNGSQAVTEAWPAENVLTTTPTVNILGATSFWQYAQISGVLDWDPGTGHGGGTVPPLPIIASAGETLSLDIGTTGNVQGDPFPIGYLQFTVSGGAYSMNGFSANNDTTCQTITNFSSQAEGSCAITFDGSGTFSIQAEYVSQDLNYSNVSLPTLTVDVS